MWINPYRGYVVLDCKIVSIHMWITYNRGYVVYNRIQVLTHEALMGRLMIVPYKQGTDSIPETTTRL